MKATVISHLNKRLFPSTRNIPLPNPHHPNDIIDIVAEVEGESPLNSTNTKWYKTNQGYYVWSGGVVKTVGPEAGKYDPAALDWWHAEFQIGELWRKLGMGKGARITIIDSGIDKTHPYFKAQNISTVAINPAWNLDDNWGHGTQVASMIIANGKNFIGIAPDVSITMIKVFDRDSTTIADLTSAIKLVPSNTDVLCTSLTLPDGPDAPALEQEIKRLKTPLVICAAGNNSDQTVFDENLPATLASAISVGATRQGASISPNSSRSKKINLVAPGHNVKCLIPNNIDYLGPDSGTSFSAPFIAGLVAIGIAYLRRKNKPIQYSAILKFLLDSTDAKADPGLHGKGIINTSKFVTKILSL